MSQQRVLLDVPIMIGVTVLLWIIALDGRIARFDGLLLLCGIVAYTVFAVRLGRRAAAPKHADNSSGAAPRASGRVAVQLAFVAAGLVLLVLGATWLVEGAVATARSLGLSELVIGLTIVAAGTSLPEVATSIVAALRSEPGIAVGNIVGSDIFNILGIGGIAALVTPGGLEVAPALVFAATAHAALPAFSNVMLGFVLPLTAATLLALWLGKRAASALNRDKAVDS